MKKFFLPVICLTIAVLFSGCGLVEDAFKAGIIFALVIIAIIGLVVYLLRITWILLIKFFPGFRIWYNDRLGYEE